MNILQLSKSLHRGGVEDHILTLAKNLNNLGHHVVVASDNLVEKETFEKENIKVYLIRFQTKNPYHIIRNIKTLKKIIQKEKIEVVHCHWRICAFYCECLRKYCNTNIPYVWTSHLAKIKNTKLLKNFTYFGDRIIAVSSDCRNMLMKEFGVDESKISVVYNGIPVTDYTNITEDEIQKNRRLFKTQNKYVVTQLSRLSPVKNHECLIRAMDILINRDEITNLICLITGTGDAEYQNTLIRMIQEKKLTDYVFLTGQVRPVDILSISDVMVLPSNVEGFPVSVLEGFAMKVPVIRTKTGGYNDVESFCLPMEFNDAEQLAANIKKIYEGELETSDMVSRAYEFILNECSDVKMTENILKIYNDFNHEKK